MYKDQKYSDAFMHMYLFFTRF